MSYDNGVGLVLAGILIGFLLFALIFPEKL